MIDVRHMTVDDYSFAVRVANVEGWDYEIQDLARFANIFPEGLLLAEEETRKLGWMLAGVYGNLMWIGSLVVQSDARGRGIGSSLMENAMEYAREKRVQTVALYSHPQATAFYSKLGFVSHGTYVSYQGTSENVKETNVGIRKPEIEEVLALDRRYFLGDRSRLLRALWKEFGELFLSSSDGQMNGYISGRKYSNGTAEIGPWVCVAGENDVADSLLETELSRIDSAKINIVVPESNRDALSVLENYEFKVEQRSPLMFKGKMEDLPKADGIYAAGAWEIG
ncbi:MAG: GNAT family N-acetyltransferase [archaeon]